MKSLTSKQAAVLHYIDDFNTVNGYSPSIAEIGEHFAMKASSAYSHVNALIRKGAIIHPPKQARSLKVVRKEPDRIYFVDFDDASLALLCQTGLCVWSVARFIDDASAKDFITHFGKLLDLKMVPQVVKHLFSKKEGIHGEN